jgi:hypothetical protein
MDGVTTALELEIGVFPVARWYDRREDAGALIHYGASVSHQGARVRAMGSVFARGMTGHLLLGRVVTTPCIVRQLTQSLTVSAP